MFRALSLTLSLPLSVVATNIAETSLTVPGVRFVVDAGYCKQKTFDPVRGVESLVVVPVSRVSADQRAGRAGRTAPGACYRLYSSACYDAMLPETVPEIMRSSLAHTALYLKASARSCRPDPPSVFLSFSASAPHFSSPT